MSIEVKLRKDETPDSLIKRFLKKYKKSGVAEEVMNRKFYKKPSVVKREKALKRKTLLKMLMEKEKDND